MFIISLGNNFKPFQIALFLDPVTNSWLNDNECLKAEKLIREMKPNPPKSVNRIPSNSEMEDQNSNSSIGNFARKFGSRLAFQYEQLTSINIDDELEVYNSKLSENKNVSNIFENFNKTHVFNDRPIRKRFGLNIMLLHPSYLKYFKN